MTKWLNGERVIDDWETLFCYQNASINMVDVVVIWQLSPPSFEFSHGFDSFFGGGEVLLVDSSTSMWNNFVEIFRIYLQISDWGRTERVAWFHRAGFSLTSISLSLSLRNKWRRNETTHTKKEKSCCMISSCNSDRLKMSLCLIGPVPFSLFLVLFLSVWSFTSIIISLADLPSTFFSHPLRKKKKRRRRRWDAIKMTRFFPPLSGSEEKSPKDRQSHNNNWRREASLVVFLAYAIFYYMFA